MTKNDVAEYLLAVLGWDGIIGDKALLADAVELWRDIRGLAFVDAYLIVRAKVEDRPVYSKNIREMEGQGINVPESLPE